MATAVEKYLSHLDTIFKVEPIFYRFSDKGVFPPLHLLIYKNIPEVGMITGFTYGISCVESLFETNIRPELVISVVSSNITWILAMADVVYQHRGKFPFEPENTINFNAKISEESEMSSFLLWYQGIFPESYEIICLPDFHIRIIQLFPIYDSERLFIKEFGTDKFFDLNPDPYNVKRKCVV